MSRRRLALLGLLLLMLVCLPDAEELWGSNVRLQTIPTRTPTPAPSSPTPPPPTFVPPPTVPLSNSPTPIPPTLVSSPRPLTTATASSALIPTADVCDEPPTIQTQTATNFRAGPGTGYPVIGILNSSEVRYIIGRAFDSPWWLVELSERARGWVADAVVTVRGFTGNVPTASAPPLNGQTPTPGIPWAPTPDPACSLGPTADRTGMLSPEPSQTKQSVPPPPESPIPDGGETAEDADEPVDTTVSALASDNISSPMESSTSATSGQPIASLESEASAMGNEISGRETQAAPATPPLEIAESSGTSSLLLIVGLILIAVAILLAIWGRSSRTD